MARSRSYIATPPGATIREQLQDRNISQKEFAARMGMSEKHISKLINGDVQLTVECAVKLELVLGVPARFWCNLEAIYREKLIKVEAENSMESDEEIARRFPYAEMAGYKWVPETRNIKEKVDNLRRYFGVVELSYLEDIPIKGIACRRLGITDKGDLALMAWTRQAKIVADGMETRSLVYVRELGSYLDEIRSMTRKNTSEFCPRLKEILAGCGIAIVFLPHLKGSFLQGATFVSGDKIVLGLTTRGGDADRFWFSLFHELGHIVLGHVGRVEETTVAEEAAADSWARDLLIPTDDFCQFQKENLYTLNSIAGFAQKMGIAPGIVVGRLQKEGLIGYDEYNELKDHYVIEV